LKEVGFAGAELARELPDGTLQLIDGHARAEVAGDAVLPVLVLDVTEAEADKILATFDPLGAMATKDIDMLDELISQVEIKDSALLTMLEGLSESAKDETIKEPELKQVVLDSVFEVVVSCASELDQKSVYEVMTERGYKCRVLTF
jgi:hypothetical protein